MDAAKKNVQPFAMQRSLVVSLPPFGPRGRWRRIGAAFAVFAGLLAFWVCGSNVAAAGQVGGSVGMGRDVTAAAVAAGCVGDCNDDGTVTVDEILLMLNIALGDADISNCTAGDADSDGHITVDEVVAAVDRALNGCEATPTPAATSTASATATPTNSPTATPTFTASGTPTVTMTPSFTSTPVPTGTPTPTPTPTSPPSLGPVITYFGLVGQDNIPLPTAGTDGQGHPIYTEPPFSTGRSVNIVVEAAAGASGSLPGTVTFNPTPVARPDLQIQADRALGNGSTLVCDAAPVGPGPTPTITPGGVPAITASTTDPQYITDALNDFGCRFRAIAASGDACTEPTPDIPRFVNNTATQRQYCTYEPTKQELAFASGDTLVTVQVRDLAGNLGDPKSIIVRVPTPAP